MNKSNSWPYILELQCLDSIFTAEAERSEPQGGGPADEACAAPEDDDQANSEPLSSG